MTRVLVTGAKGFIGKNLCLVLRERKDVVLFETDIDTPSHLLAEAVTKTDVIMHLAGINRPKDPSEFETGNAGSIEEVISLADACANKPTIVITSSIQAALDNAYGISKLHAEQILAEYSRRTASPVYIYRLANAFGKWSRPFYNSVIATFCHQATHGESFRIDDPAKVIDFVYIDDIVASLIGVMDGKDPVQKNGFYSVEPIFSISLGEIAEMLNRFIQSRSTCVLPVLSDTFEKYLYSTYLSYLDADKLSYAADMKNDDRGYLFELIKSPAAGQIFVSRTLPGITRGNHYHHTKVEKFCVADGRALISFRHISSGEKKQIHVDGTECRIVDIPPGWTHNIKNIGTTDLITIFWANEIFSQEKPDTIYAGVDDEKN
jgi:UDP-2-acetamido-2,6-beta-L-arabino-hexul-4-ose reductase